MHNRRGDVALALDAWGARLGQWECGRWAIP